MLTVAVTVVYKPQRTPTHKSLQMARIKTHTGAGAAPAERKPSKKERAADAAAEAEILACACAVQEQCGIIAAAFKVLQENVEMHDGEFKQRFMNGVSYSGECAFNAGTVAMRDLATMGSNAGFIREYLEKRG